MSANDTYNRSKTLEVFEALVELGFQGQTMADIASHCGFSYAAVRRSLLVLENHGWVVEAPQSGTKQKLWMPGEKLVQVAFQYKRNCQNHLHAIQQDYLNVSGEALRDD